MVSPKDAYFLTRHFRGTASFSFSKKIPFFLSQERKKASFAGTKNIIPGWSMYYIKHTYTIRSGLWAVIFSHFHSTLYPIHRSVVAIVFKTST